MMGEEIRGDTPISIFPMKGEEVRGTGDHKGRPYQMGMR